MSLVGVLKGFRRACFVVGNRNKYGSQERLICLTLSEILDEVLGDGDASTASGTEQHDDKGVGGDK